MEKDKLNAVFDGLKHGESAFHELMMWRIRRVMLILPHYDAWILEHDAKLSDQIVGEYHQLNLTTVPRLVTVPNCREALELLAAQSFDLLIIGIRVGELSPIELAHEAKLLQSDLAILMLLSSRSDLAIVEREKYTADEMGKDIARGRQKNGRSIRNPLGMTFDAKFLWTGDSRLFLAMIKYVEDLRNASDDTKDGRVGVLLVVENSIAFYSAYLPLLYGEIMTQTQRLIAEEMNDNDKYWRMRTRPKILLARDWEEAVYLGEKFRTSLIGIVSDIAFERDGKLDEYAGFALIERFRRNGVEVPVLFQSSDEGMAGEARRQGTRFQNKHSGNLHREIRRFILEELGFGDFVFRNPDGSYLSRVQTLREFALAVESMPSKTLLYHSDRKDYSRWMAAHGEYQVARRIREVKTTDFPTPELLRDFLVRSFREVRESRHKGRLVDFSCDDPGASGSVARFGSGSLGGKGRGLAFFNALLNNSSWGDSFAPLSIEIPRTLIIATGEFDRFLEETGLLPEFEGGKTLNDWELREAFLKRPLREELMAVLNAFAEFGPLAIRSSTLLEDSQSIPCAGVYDTFMLPEISAPGRRVEMIAQAVKLVWASTFSADATVYRNALGVGREEEKMAVVVQRMSGSKHGSYWFPRLSGVAQSFNYYPIAPMGREDGVARIAIGLGRSVVEGEKAYLFCPAFPSIPWGIPEDKWREGQTHFWALKETTSEMDLKRGESGSLERLTIRDAENLKVLSHMASTWDPVGRRIVDGIKTPGVRVVDFRDILEYEWLPLSPLLDQLLHITRSAMGIPVELEFSVDWNGDIPEGSVFSLLQVRPLITSIETILRLPLRPSDERLILRSDRSLGHGLIGNIKDIVWVDPELYDSGDTESLRINVASLTEKLAREGRYAILIGPGRWGSKDRFLGIPVNWTEVRQAKLIVEIHRGPGDPEPSQGSHFFYNLISLGVGYAHINYSNLDNFVNWELLRKRCKTVGPVCLSSFEKAIEIVMDGKNGLTWAAL
ncbi:Phosphoenolpyruvate synthase / Pyruvate phosphate dikinase [Olavius algarvensis spirochete endosymbiont]|uniref:PEP/pyruvate-binding domain-containing protein n=1 Tax=Olavius algarvensis spirochete endosymbiont TaxID=260710 RepID=UPI000689A226|nr:PEP/pyruvate-binding domain-containing protein [Olavius algarvensis spirochete endosymbiont]VDB00021.1 Phosphoenolpyruvate synthase / Pyruvate phosphate dikinase [Olavius algarvensis spirochete endosymbiont]